MRRVQECLKQNSPEPGRVTKKPAGGEATAVEAAKTWRRAAAAAKSAPSDASHAVQSDSANAMTKNSSSAAM